MKQAVGYIKTTLKGSGRAKLHFGNCYNGNAVRKIPMNPKSKHLKATSESELKVHFLNWISTNFQTV